MLHRGEDNEFQIDFFVLCPQYDSHLETHGIMAAVLKGVSAAWIGVSRGVLAVILVKVTDNTACISICGCQRTKKLFCD